MIANTVPLVRQQANAISQNTSLTVGCYDGSMGVDLWDKKKVGAWGGKEGWSVDLWDEEGGGREAGGEGGGVDLRNKDN